MAEFGNIDTSLKVLVVDDYALTRAMVQSILKSVGFDYIKQADSGLSAGKKLEEEKFDLVVCDWNMPNGSGIDVLKRTRSMEHNQNQDVLWLMLTAEGYRENVEEAIAAGASSFVVKPFTADVLLEKVHSLVATRFSTD